MALTVWTKPSGVDFGTFKESSQVVKPANFSAATAWTMGTSYTVGMNVLYNGNTYTCLHANTGLVPDANIAYWGQVVVLPSNGTPGVSYTIISGSLPVGMFLDVFENIPYIHGTPFVVANTVPFTFCVRASNGLSVSDRTFKLTVDGASSLIFVTPPGALSVGVHEQFYAASGTFVSYQLEAYDLTTEIGQTLSYFISSNAGSLPPGLTLSSTGLISGYIEPILSIDGVTQYDPVFGITSEPKEISANFRFTVTLSNGVIREERIFAILVVGPDEFRADSVSSIGFASGFTSDATYLREPVWRTDKNLGIHRANNYLTIPIALYDNRSTTFRLEPNNQEVYAVTEQVIIPASDPPRIDNNDNVVGANTVTVGNVKGTLAFGQYFTFGNYLTGAPDTVYRIGIVDDLGNGTFRITLAPGQTLDYELPNGVPFYIGSQSVIPTGTSFDAATGSIVGIVPYQPAITKTYTFTVNASRYGDSTVSVVNTYRTFNITMLGEVTSTIVWETPSNLGTVAAEYICTLDVKATSNVPNAVVLYEVVGGLLPPGLTLNLDGEILGSVDQFAILDQGGNIISPGLITFDGGTTTFDNSITTFDRTYKFTVQASDQFNYSSITREFSISIVTLNTVPYSNIRTQPFLVPEQRSLWRQFISDTTIFTPSSIYRANDPNFGMHTSLSMLVYAGIERQTAATYAMQMMESGNFKRKRFQFGSISKAEAIDPASGNTVYEVIYVQMIDPLELNGKHLPQHVSLNSSQYQVSSITNWQEQLSNTGITERNYLPLWMRSMQPGSKEQLGYALAVPLCFCKAGTADEIMLNIKHSGFDFRSLDYTVDRFTIDAVTEYTSDKYLAFSNDRTTV